MRSFVALLFFLGVSLAATSIWPKNVPVHDLTVSGGKVDLASFYAEHCDLVSAAVAATKTINESAYTAFAAATTTPGFLAAYLGDNVEAACDAVAIKCNIAKADMYFHQFAVDTILPVNTASGLTGAAVAFVGKSGKAAMVATELTVMDFATAQKVYFAGQTKELELRSVMGYFGAISTRSLDSTYAVARVVAIATPEAAINEAINNNNGGAARITYELLSCTDATCATKVLAAATDATTGTMAASLKVVVVDNTKASVYQTTDAAGLVSTDATNWVIGAGNYATVATVANIDTIPAKGDDCTDSGILASATSAIIGLGAERVELGENAVKMFYVFPIRSQSTIEVTHSHGETLMQHCYHKKNSYGKVAVCDDKLPLFDTAYFCVSLALLAITATIMVYGLWYGKKFTASGENQILTTKIDSGSDNIE